MEGRFFILIILLIVNIILPSSTYAAPALDPYTEENFWLLPHTKPAWFEADGNNSFYGKTVDGVYFTQTAVTNTEGIKLQRFSIGTAEVYISDRGIIEADSDLAAVSVYLALI